MKSVQAKKLFALLTLLCGVWMLTACNSGGGGGDDDPPGPPGRVFLANASYSVAQNQAEVLVTVSRSSGATAAVSVNYATANGTAIAGSDYTLTSGTLSWAADDASDKTISIPIAEADPYTGTKNFTLALSAGDGDHNAAVATPDTATISIFGLYVPPTACGYATPSATALSTTGQCYDPVNLSSADGLSEHPAIAVAPPSLVGGEGRVFVVWEDDEKGQKAILFSQSKDYGATYFADPDAEEADKETK